MSSPQSLTSASQTDVPEITPDDKKDPAQDAEHLESQKQIDSAFDTKYASLNRKTVVKTFWRCMIFCMIANWAALNDGFQQQLPGNVIPLPGFVSTMADTMIDGVPAISARTISFWGGFGSVSQTVAQYFGATMSDYIGRKGTMIFFCVLFLLGSSLEITARNWQWWLGSQIVIKFAIGTAQSVLIVYVSEIAPFQLRGTMIAAYQLFLAGGQLIGSIATQIMVATNPGAWKPLIASEFVFTGLLILMLPFVPESHLFYARKGDHEKAKKAMVRIYGTASEYDVDHEYNVIRYAIEAEKASSADLGGSSWFEIFRGVNFRRTLAGSLGICAQPLSGGPIVFSYSTYFFSVAGLQDPFLTTVIVFVTLLVFIMIAMWLCEIVGRRPLLLGGCTAMFFFNIGLAVTGSFESQASGKTALGMLLLWVMAYAMSSAPIGFVSAGETSTPRLRAKTTAFNFAAYSGIYLVFQWVVPYLISPDSANLGVKAAYIFAGFLVPLTIAIYFYYPETTGRTYVELDELYARKLPARKFKTATTTAEAQGIKNAALTTH